MPDILANQPSFVPNALRIKVGHDNNVPWVQPNGNPWVDFDAGWVKEGFTRETAIYAENFGHWLAAAGLGTSQIRIVYSELVRITQKVDILEKSQTINDLVLLKPRVNYQATRANKKWSKGFVEEFEKQLTACLTTDADKSFKEAIKRFQQLQEAILAYHKRHGGQS